LLCVMCTCELSELKFDTHVALTVAFSVRQLKFLGSSEDGLKDLMTLIRKNYFMYRPILDYGSCVWSQQYSYHQDRIESVQKKFLLFALRGFNWVSGSNLPPYTSILLLINLSTLTNRRTMLGDMFMIKLVTGEIDFSYLLSQINFSVPSSTPVILYQYPLIFVLIPFPCINPFDCSVQIIINFTMSSM